MQSAMMSIKRAFKVTKDDDTEGPKAKRARTSDVQTQIDLPLHVKAQTPTTPRRSDRLLCSRPAQISVPLDIGVADRESEDCKVHVDGNGVAFDATLCQTDSECPVCSCPADKGGFHAGEHRSTCSSPRDDTSKLTIAPVRETNNVNKFCRMQVLKLPKTFETYEKALQQFPYLRYKLWIRGGRIGGRNNIKSLGFKTVDAAVRQFERRFEKLTGHSWADRASDSEAGYYALIDMTYDISTESPDQGVIPVKSKKKANTKARNDPKAGTLSKASEELMAFIFDWKTFEETMSTMNYDASSMPLGRLSETNLKAGFTMLSKIADLLATISQTDIEDRSEIEDTISNLSCQYWSKIPRKFGSQKAPRIDNTRLIKHEVGALNSLVKMKEGIKLREKADQVEQAETSRYRNAMQRLDLEELLALDRKSDEFREINQYLGFSRGKSHAYDYGVEEIFRVQRRQEFARPSSHPGPSDRRLLWHGSRSANFGGILSEGLRIAPLEAPSTGLMFGKGIYFADVSSKSAQYCCHELSRDTGLLLLCEVELRSSMLELFNADYQAHQKVAGLGIRAVRGVGHTKPKTWKDAGCVHPNLRGVKMPMLEGLDSDWHHDPRGLLLYDEYVVYNVEQVRLRYLIRTKIWKDWILG